MLVWNATISTWINCIEVLKTFAPVVAMTNQTLIPGPLLECPSCGKHTIVEHRAGVYRCIACDFERNLEYEDSKFRRKHHSHSHQKDDDVNPLPLLLLGVVLILVML